MYKFLLSMLLLISCLVGCSSESKMIEKTASPSAENINLIARAKAVHASALTLDAHADIEIPGKPSSYVGRDGLSKVAPSKMRDGGLDAVVMAMAVGPMPRNAVGYATAAQLAQTKLEAVKMLVADKANNSVIVLSTDDLITAHKEGKSALLLGFQNALILGTEIDGINDSSPSPIWATIILQIHHAHYLMVILAGESRMQNMVAYPI